MRRALIPLAASKYRKVGAPWAVLKRSNPRIRLMLLGFCLGAPMLALGACGPMLNPTVLHDAQGSQIHGAPGSLAMTLKGAACGQPFEANIADNKDRQQVQVSVECPGGGKITAQTIDSNGSTAMVEALKDQAAANAAAQANVGKALDLAGVAAGAVGKVATGGVAPLPAALKASGP